MIVCNFDQLEIPSNTEHVNFNDVLHAVAAQKEEEKTLTQSCESIQICLNVFNIPDFPLSLLYSPCIII